MPHNNKSLALLEPLEKQTSLSNRAYLALRDAIVNGVLGPGERITERAMAKQLNISTTPVREAMRRLEQDGMLIGNAVVEAPPIEEIYQTRALLHGMGARLAAEKIIEEELEELRDLLSQTTQLINKNASAEDIYETFRRFHMLVVAASRNVFLFKFQTTLGPFVKAVRLNLVKDRNVAIRHHQLHIEILNAITDRDGAKAEELMKSHISDAIRIYLSRS